MIVISGRQPGYLPWLGFFHKILLSDRFVVMDDVKFSKTDFHNRNRIKGAKGGFWLTVPVETSGSRSPRIADVTIKNDSADGPSRWQQKHWSGLVHCYAKTPYWEDYSSFFEAVYNDRRWGRLVDLNLHIIRWVMKTLDMDTELIIGSEMGFEGRKSDLVLDHCAKLDADVCVLGAHGRDYIDEQKFLDQGISLFYQDYDHPVYPQTWSGFDPYMSVVDLLFNVGPNAKNVIIGDNVTKEDLVKAAHDVGKASVLRDVTRVSAR